MHSAISCRRASLIASLALTFMATDASRAQDAPPSALSPVVRVTLRVDSTTTAGFDARAFDLTVSPAGPQMGNAEIQLVKKAGPQTGVLLSLSARRIRALGATIEVLDSLGAPALTFRLTDVTVLSDRLSFSATRANLEQQRISQQEALSALSADYQEALRQLATAEELGKNQVGTRLELARARDRVSDLHRRADLARQRQALLASQLSSHGLEETIVLRFRQLELESGEPGGRTVIDGASRPW